MTSDERPIPVAVLGAVQGHHKASLILRLNSVSYILGRDQIKALIHELARVYGADIEIIEEPARG